jgi:hypothetical protein
MPSSERLSENTTIKTIYELASFGSQIKSYAKYIRFIPSFSIDTPNFYVRH